MRRNPSVSLQSQFPGSEYALLTAEEFLSRRDPEGKTHPSDVYDASLASLNQYLYQIGSTAVYGHWRDKGFLVEASNFSGSDGIVFRDPETKKTAAVFKDGILYKNRFAKIPDQFRDSDGEWRKLNFSNVQEVKYPSQFEPQRDNRAKFSFVIQRVVLNGDSFEVRAERKPVPDKLDTIAFLNHKGELVALGSNEWGASLLQVAREYRGRGIGKLLAQTWYALNPNSKSGGFTVAGRSNARAAWEDTVRKWLSMGWYSELVRTGKITPSRVKNIIAGLSNRRKSDPFLPGVKNTKSDIDLRLYIDEDRVAFVLYDARFLESNDEDYILGYGFLRSTQAHGLFFYRLEYEPEYRGLASSIALQLAKDTGERLYVAKPPADLIEWSVVPHANLQDGYVMLTQNILPLRKLALAEKKLRQDPFNQKQYALLEAAEAKWS